MTNVDPRDSQFVQAVRVLQIVVAALLAGVVMFTGVVLQMNGLLPLPEKLEDVDLISIIGIVFAVLVLPLQWIVGRIVAAGAIRMQGLDDPKQQGEPEAWRPWFGVYQTKTIISAAMCEGIAFMNLAYYMIFKSSVSLFGAAILVVALALMFPTPARVAAWIDAQQQRIRQEEQFRR